MEKFNAVLTPQPPRFVAVLRPKPLLVAKLAEAISVPASKGEPSVVRKRRT